MLHAWTNFILIVLIWNLIYFVQVLDYFNAQCILTSSLILPSPFLGERLFPLFLESFHEKFYFQYLDTYEF